LVSDEAARAAAREILAQPEFTRWHSDFEAWLRALEGLVERLPDWLIEVVLWLQEYLLEGILLNLLRWIGQLLGLVGEPPGALGVLAVCLLLAAAIVLAYRIWGSRWRQTRAGPDAPGTHHNHADSIREARALARDGHYLEAAHRVQLATLALLIETDWLELARSDPNRTLRRRVSASSLPERERRQLIALVDRLESLWFDQPREDRQLFDEWLALDERMLRLTGGSGA
jgi:hypothetical protein